MSNQLNTSLGITVRLQGDFDSAVAQVTAALKAEGFGVLTEIDVKETMKKKLDVDYRPYKILGACNPALAHRAITAAPEIGLLLPCNVIVYQTEDGAVETSLIDPLIMVGFMGNPGLKSVAEEANARMLRVAEALRKGLTSQ